jgi:alkanesulfonate monooxygenase SsuD/methylene tetrahydromethanopterin reductase-like flavin-dependent oxidoreductase (luciferase family)
VIGLHCSHEQIPPSRLLEHAKHAEAAGFAAIMSSDHFSPWGERQGESGFAWSWLGAAMASTQLPFGVVNAPGQRYHPAIVAQAAADPVRDVPRALVGRARTGEASNEHITGDPWPDKATRNARLRECVDVMRALFAGETVSHHGLVHVDRRKAPYAARAAAAARRPGHQRGNRPVGRRVGRRAGNGQPAAGQARGDDRRLPLQRRRGQAAGPAGPSVVGCEPRRKRSEVAYEQWRTNVFPPPVCWDLEMVEDFDRRARDVTREQVRDVVLVSADLGRHTAWLQELMALGFDEINLHHVGQDLTSFIDAFGEHVLPELSA